MLDELKLTTGQLAAVYKASHRRYRGTDGPVKRASVTSMLTWFLREWVGADYCSQFEQGSRKKCHMHSIKCDWFDSDLFGQLS